MSKIKKILKVYKGPKIIKIKRLKFLNVQRRSVYNVTAPFDYNKKSYIIGRVENKQSISEIVFFRRGNGHFVPDDSFQKFNLEDPHLVKISDLFVLSGVETKPFGNKLKWRTVFYKGKDLKSLKKFAAGPWGMKDIRLVQLADGKIGVFTRPQGKKGRRGKIGYIEISSLKEIKPRKLASAHVIQHLFGRGEWGGANEPLVLNSGKIGILGHIARFTRDKNKFYYPMVFAFDPVSKKTSDIRLIGRRAELPEGDAKSPDLYNVIFPGGVKRNGDGTAKVYVGVGDLESYEITMEDPFKYYEEKDREIFG
jgi:hypothetical protein